MVCPASIMDQWKAEVKNRVKSHSINVILHHGNNREIRPKPLSKHDMVITTYGIVSSECDNVNSKTNRQRNFEISIRNSISSTDPCFRSNGSELSSMRRTSYGTTIANSR